LLQGQVQDTSSNAALLYGTARALEALECPCDVTVYTVSDYLGKGASSWVVDWRRRGWRTAGGKPVQNREGGKPVQNREEWEALLRAAAPHRVVWRVMHGDAIPPDLERARQAVRA